MRAAAFLTAFTLGSALLAGPLAAQSDKTWETCIAVDGTPASRFEACTAIIEAKSETGRRLAGAYCIRGHELTEKRDLDAALADLNEAIRLDPTYACAYNNRGRAYGFKREYDRAIEDYNEALRLDPNFALAYNNRGDRLARQGRPRPGDRRFRAWQSASIPRSRKPTAIAATPGITKREPKLAIEDYSVEIRIAPNLMAYHQSRQCLSRHRAARPRGRGLRRGHPHRADRRARLAQPRPDPAVPGELQSWRRRLRQGARIRPGATCIPGTIAASRRCGAATRRAPSRTSARRWNCGRGLRPRSPA